MGIDPKDCHGDGVYLIRCQDFYKIGKTSSMRIRLTTLQIGTPFKLKIVCWLSCRGDQSSNSLEAQLQNAYKEKCVGGEWYKLTDKDIAEIQSRKPIKKKAKSVRRRHRTPIKRIAPIKKPAFHPDWYYWDWKKAYEPWKVSRAKEMFQLYGYLPEWCEV